MKFKQKGWVVLSGDDGGQIYMTIPTEFLAYTSSKDLLSLIRTLNFLEWPTNDGGAGAFFRCGCGRPDVCGDVCCGTKWVIGGMGGGRVFKTKIWIHSNILALGKPFVDRIEQSAKLIKSSKRTIYEQNDELFV